MKLFFQLFCMIFLLELREDLKVEIPNDIILRLMKISEKEIIKAKREGRLVKERRFEK